MIYGYIRVSSDKQTLENQKFEIEKFVKINNLKIDKWVKEIISSRIDLKKRKLGKLLNIVKTGDIIIASELSRFGRNLLQIMSILNKLLSREVQVWTIKDNYRLGEDISSKVLAFAFGLSAEIERKLISDRTKEALARIKAEGKQVGRPKGSKNFKLKLTGKEEIIKSLIYKGFSKSKIARKLHVHRITLNTFIENTLR